MLPIDVVVQEGLDPAAAYAGERALLRAVEEGARPAALRGWSLGGEVVGLGRYHLAPALDGDRSVSVHRRRTGGRVAPLGAGFAGIALTLPHRAALVAADPLALRPEQALNRFVRALLAALRRLGVDAFYAGRDVVSVAGRLLGVVGLAAEASGATLFEAVLAVERDWSCLPSRIEAVDRDGVVLAEQPGPDRVTALARHVARAPTTAELVHAVGGALAQEFGALPRASAVEAGSADPASFAAWLGERCRPSAFDRHALALGQLGAFEVYLSLDGGGRIDRVLLAGDFLADSASVAKLEERLQGCALEVDAVEAVLRGVYAAPHSFLLGMGPLRTVAEAIAAAR